MPPSRASFSMKVAAFRESKGESSISRTRHVPPRGLKSMSCRAAPETRTVPGPTSRQPRLSRSTNPPSSTTQICVISCSCPLSRVEPGTGNACADAMGHWTFPAGGKFLFVHDRENVAIGVLRPCVPEFPEHVDVTLVFRVGHVVPLERHALFLEITDDTVDVVDGPCHGSCLVCAGVLRHINENVRVSALEREHAGLGRRPPLEAQRLFVELSGDVEVFNGDRWNCICVAEHWASIAEQGIARHAKTGEATGYISV